MAPTLVMNPLTSSNGSEPMASPVRVEGDAYSRVNSPSLQDLYPTQRGLPYTLATEERQQVHGSWLFYTESHSTSSASWQTSSSMADELFFDTPSPTHPPAWSREEERSLTSYLVTEPAVEEEPRIESTEWKRYEAPQELLKFQDGISQDLESTLVPSIGRIKARHREEEQRKAAASRVERPLTRAERVCVRPRRQLSITATLDTTHLIPPSISSAASETSLSSNDSGYASASPVTEASRSPRSTSRKSFGFASRFKRKDRVAVHPQELDENFLLHPRSSEGWLLSDSPLSPPMRPAPNSQSQTGECVSCLDGFTNRELIKLTCHSYCRGCFQRLVDNALESETHWPPKCCLNPIPSPTLLPHLTSSTIKKYHLRSTEWSIPAQSRIYCSKPTCSTFIPPKNTHPSTNTATCPTCSTETCTTCLSPSHGTKECPSDPSLLATISLAETEGWKRCYSCQALVEHNKGCRHMTCRCKAQFCYICGLKWRTCACSDAQLVDVRILVEERRVRGAREVERRDRERLALEREEREVAEAIRTVEEFVRVEEERAAREIEEVRRREEEERVRREEERIANIDKRFRALDGELERLSDMQRVLMAERYEFEMEGLRKHCQDAKQTLSIRHPTEVQHLVNESSVKINDMAAKFNNEYALRLCEERRIEDQYVDELREYWSEKPNGEHEVRKARDELRQDQNKQYRFWDNSRRQELEHVRQGEEWKLEAMRVKQAAQSKAVDERAKTDSLEWERKRFAERKWAEVVVTERIAMLGEMEAREYSRGS